MRLLAHANMFILFIVTVLSGCQSGQQNSRTPLNVPPPDFYMNLGQGGGATGAWEGYSITAGGEVYSWRSLGTRMDSTGVRTLDSDELASLWRTIDSTGFFNSEMTEPDNMSVAITVVANGRKHRVIYPQLLRDRAKDMPLQTLYTFCTDLIRERP